MRVAVLGGGPTGVGAAYGCAKRGHDVTLFEALPVVGGHAASVTVADRRVDLGSHRLHPSCAPDVLADLRRLLGDDLRPRRRHGRIRLGERWVAFPLRPGDLLAHLPPRLTAGLVRDLVSPRRRVASSSDSVAASYADVLLGRFGPVLCEQLWFPYARKLWGLDPGSISARQAQVRVGARSGWSVAARAARAGVLGPPRFWYPRGGFGRISECLAAAARSEGAEVRLSTPVGAIAPEAAGPVWVRHGSDETAADLALSTLPLPDLAALVPDAPGAARQAAAALDHRGMLVVYLVFDTGPVSEFDAHYLPGDGVATARVSEPRHYAGDWPGGRTILCCEVPCAEGDASWQRADSDVVDGVLRDLSTSGIELPSPPAGSRVLRLSRVYPLYRRGHEAEVAELEAWVRGLSRLVTLGRQGLFLHDNTHHALEMGYVAAACAGRDGFDTAAWARARERFTSNVVED